MKIVATPTLDEVIAWFERAGGTDFTYLRGSYVRFAATHAYVTARLPTCSRIADIGAHWLHQAFFFARDGHRISALDVPHMVRNPLVQDQAREMNIVDLSPLGLLEKGEGLEVYEESTFDAVFFFEIIEHLAFNPIQMWKALFRVLRPGGKIFVSTPNAAYHESIMRRLVALENKGEYGITLEEIWSIGTLGHHWREFSPPEMRAYFAKFEPSLRLTDIYCHSDRSEDQERWLFSEHLVSKRPQFVDFERLIIRLDQLGAQPFAGQMLLEISVSEDKQPITLSAPW